MKCGSTRARVSPHAPMAGPVVLGPPQVEYNSIIYSKSNNLVFNVVISVYLRDKTLAITFSFPCFYLIT